MYDLSRPVISHELKKNVIANIQQAYGQTLLKLLSKSIMCNFSRQQITSHCVFVFFFFFKICDVLFFQMLNNLDFHFHCSDESFECMSKLAHAHF